VSLHLQPDWQRAVGQHVEVQLNGKIIRAGTVEAVMPDDSILWISADGVDTREMFEKVDGNHVYARYAWNDPP
jgi:ribosome maturation factor RimP